MFASLPQFEPGLADEAGSARPRLHRGRGARARRSTRRWRPRARARRAWPAHSGRLAQNLQQAGGRRSAQGPAAGARADRPRWSRSRRTAVPYASLIVDGVDEKKAGDALAVAAAAAPARGRHRQRPGAELPDQGRRRGHRALRPGLADASTSPTRSSTASWSSRRSRRGSPRSRSSGDDLAGTSAYRGRDGPAPGPGLGASLPQPR